MKNLLLLLLPFLIHSHSFAQNIHLKHRKVLFGTETVMTYEKIGLGAAMHLKCKEHGKTIVCIALINHEKRPLLDNAYTRIQFGKDHWMNTTLKMGFEEWVMLMSREAVFNEKWELDMEKVENFIRKHERKVVPKG